MRLIQIIDYASMAPGWGDIASSCAPSADVVWFRIKNLPDDVIKAEALRMRSLLPESFLVLSARADIASGAGFSGVQLGASTEKPADVKRKYPALAVGYSAHSLEEMDNNPADYYTLSPVFFTKKDYEVKPLGALDVSATGKTVYALGGINAVNVSQLKGLGYAGIAGISFYQEIEKLKNLISTL